MNHGPGSNGWGAVGKPKADCGGSSPVELRCDGSSHSVGRHNAQLLRERVGSGGGWGAAELAAQQEPSWVTLPSNCRGMTSVAFICLVLVRYCNMLKAVTTPWHRNTCLNWRLDNRCITDSCIGSWGLV